MVDDAASTTDASTRSGLVGRDQIHRRRLQRSIVATVWVGALTGWIVWLRVTHTSPVDSLQAVIDVLQGAWWAIPAYLVLYLVRPLILFPAALLTISAGILFGPVVGIAVTIVAANLSALVAYCIGATFSPAAWAAQAAEAGDAGFVARWSTRLRTRSFVTVMVMRLAFLPYDLVNYVCGFLRIEVVPFIAATAIGSLPGTVAFVLAGASVQRIDAGTSGFDPKVFAASVVLFIAALAVARVLNRRETAT